MSGFGGGGTRGRGGGRGRSGGRGGGSRGGGGGGGHHDPHPTGPPPRLKPCRSYTSTGACPNTRCSFAHVVKVHASIDASTKQQNQTQHYHSHGNKMHPVSTVSLWENPGHGIKIFSGCHDGRWRLWNTSGGTFAKEFEHNMGGGKVDVLVVASNFLFCGFEGTSVKVPGVAVGMIHAWNLGAPADPPLEFHMGPLAPYAAAKGVTSLKSSGDKIVSGSRDGVVRIWGYDASAGPGGAAAPGAAGGAAQAGGGKGGFKLLQTLHGHAGEVTGLAVTGVPPAAMLWSSSVDATIRLWDMSSGECKHLITRDTPGGGQAAAAAASGSNNSGIGHALAVTALLPFESPAVGGSFVFSSSLDATVKAWNSSNGECMATETHGEGVLCMALSADAHNHPLLLIGLERGNIMVRNVLQTPNCPAFCLLFTLSPRFTTGHDGPVKSIESGPSGTFYSGGDDGKLIVWQIDGDLGI